MNQFKKLKRKKVKQVGASEKRNCRFAIRLKQTNKRKAPVDKSTAKLLMLKNIFKIKNMFIQLKNYLYLGGYN